MKNRSAWELSELLKAYGAALASGVGTEKTKLAQATRAAEIASELALADEKAEAKAASK